MQTITTKYLSPTDCKGSRFKATHTGGVESVTISRNYAVEAEDNHRAAAHALAKKLNWQGSYIGGHTKDGMIWVNSKPLYKFNTKDGVDKVLQRVSK